MGKVFLILLPVIIVMGFIAANTGNPLSFVAFLLGIYLLIVAIPAIIVGIIRWLVRDVKREWNKP
jgi:ABC-type polysaccharide/polyol phosphate export permease